MVSCYSASIAMTIWYSPSLLSRHQVQFIY